MNNQSAPELTRIAKVIANSGACSRREAEKFILLGRVKVDGQLATTPNFKVSTNQVITLDDKPIYAQTEIRIYKFYKPDGTLTTKQDTHNRQTIYDVLPKKYANLIYIGRLDYNSEGLLLLTNNGEIARKLTLPKNNLEREYKVRAYGFINEKRLDELRKGATIEGITYNKAKISIDKQGRTNHWLTIIITEGKNREIRKMLEYADLTVNRLIRVRFGSIFLNDLKIGEIVELKGKELNGLL